MPIPLTINPLSTYFLLPPGNQNFSIITYYNAVYVGGIFPRPNRDLHNTRIVDAGSMHGQYPLNIPLMSISLIYRNILCRYSIHE